MSSFDNPDGFLAALNRTNASTWRDGSVDESVLDGVSIALPPGPEDIASHHVNWPTGRAGELATKLLVLLGDAPDHARDLDRAKAVAERARASGITIATVAIDRPGALSRDERARYRDQWRTLAEESYRPLDKASGFASPIAPITASLQEGEQLAERLQALIDDRVEHARTIAGLAAAEAEGRLGEYVNSQGLTLDRVAPVLVDLHRGDAARVARPDPRFDGRKAPSVRKGWIADRARRQADGRRRDAHVERRAEDTDCRADATPAGRLGNGPRPVGACSRSALPRRRARPRSSRPIEARGPSPTTSVVDKDSRPRSREACSRGASPTCSAPTTSPSRRSNAKLRASLLQLTRRLQAPDWNDPRRTIDGMALVPYEAIDF